MDEACSGIVSLMSIVAVGAIYCVWRRYSLLRTVCLLVVGIGWAFVSNVFRILVIAVADSWYGLDLAERHITQRSGSFSLFSSSSHC